MCVINTLYYNCHFELNIVYYYHYHPDRWYYHVGFWFIIGDYLSSINFTFTSTDQVNKIRLGDWILIIIVMINKSVYGQLLMVKFWIQSKDRRGKKVLISYFFSSSSFSGFLFLDKEDQVWNVKDDDEKLKDEDDNCKTNTKTMEEEERRWEDERKKVPRWRNVNVIFIAWLII